MLRNYLKVISRNIYKNKLYASINILGLAMGFTAFILIFIYIHYETSFESFHSKADRIYRASYAYDSGNGYGVHWARVPVTYINELPDEIPEIERLIRFQNHERKYIRVGENKFKPNHVYITDNEIFDVFDFPVIAGNPETALSEPNSIVITESLAKKYFGESDALNKDIYVLGDWSTEEKRHKVTAIMMDPPPQSHLPIEMLISFQNEEERSGWAYVYILLNETTDIENVNSKMSQFIQKHAEEKYADKVVFEFQPLRKIHLHSNLAREIVPNGSAAYIKIFIAAALFILLVALVNYINLNSALVLSRSKEIGLRKILGGGNTQLVNYLLLESIVNNLMALLVAGCIAFILFPYFCSLTGIEFILNPWWFGTTLILIAIFCGLLTGIFPILSLPIGDPLQQLKASKIISFSKSKSSFNLKRVLVTLQYSISILLIGSAFIARDQFKFLNESNLGIAKEQILAISSVLDGIRDDYKTFKDRLVNIPGVASVTGCMEVPSREIRDAGPVLVKGVNTDNEKSPIMDIQIVDHDYVDLLGIELIAGQNIPQSMGFKPIPEFTEEFTFQNYLEEERRAYLINETAMRELGWETPGEALGQEINWSIGSF